MTQPITPYLLYEDVEAALEFFARAFSWCERGERMTSEDGRVNHAAVDAEGGVIMLGRPGPAYRNPKHLGGSTQSLYVRVTDADAHHARAAQAGARIIEEPNGTFYGDRRYGLEDPEGHVWYFASSL